MSCFIVFVDKYKMENWNPYTHTPRENFLKTFSNWKRCNRCLFYVYFVYNKYVTTIIVDVRLLHIISYTLHTILKSLVGEVKYTYCKIDVEWVVWKEFNMMRVYDVMSKTYKLTSKGILLWTKYHLHVCIRCV